MRIVRTLSFLLLIGICAFQLYAQALGRARGKVTDPDGKPIEGAVITFEAIGDMPHTLTTKTDKKGEYLHIGIPPGKYKITPSKDGYTPVNYAFVNADVTLSDKPLIANFTMASTAKMTAAAGQQQQAQQNPPEDKLVEAKQALALMDAGKTDEAIDAFKKAIEKNPESASLHYNLGVAYEKKDKMADAQKEYQEAIRVNPELGEAYQALGNSYLTSGSDTKLGNDEKTKDFTMAADAFSKASNLMPTSYPVFYNLGVSYANMNKYPDAEAAFRKAAAISPKEPIVHYQLGMALFGQSKNAEAKTEFQQYLTLNPNAADKQDVLDLMQSLQ